MSLGIISDTHGLLRDEALEALRDSDGIIHAGDVGRNVILDKLAVLAPVVVVRGNVDKGEWTQRLPRTATMSVGTTLIYVLHDLHDLDLDPRAASVRVVVSGHSHQPSIHESEGVLYLNPGSAGPRRFKLPVTVAHLEVSSSGEVSARLIDLAV